MTQPLDRLVASATGTLHRSGLVAGDVALSVLPNDRHSFAVAWAMALAGVVQVPLSTSNPAAEVAQLADASGATAVLVDRRSPPTAAVTDVLRSRGLRTVPIGADPPRDPDTAAPRTRAMSFTSGTTGRRKGVVVGVHGEGWGRAWLDDESAAFRGRHGERHLVVSPLYHSGPLRHALVTADRGGEVAVLARFDVELWLDALRTYRPTSLFCVPTQLHRLLAHPDLAADDLASLTLLVHAGAPCPIPLKHRLLELAPDDTVWEFYGSTEGQFSVCPPAVWRAAAGTVGHARPGGMLGVRDDGGAPLRDGEIGTVWTTAPAHGRWSYLDAPVATAAAWDGDWFTVGDLGRLDDGLLTLVGRRHDLVITGGVNVYPAEVEQVLLEDDDVGEATVFGVDDVEWGQRLVAAITPAPGRARVDPAAVRERLRGRLGVARVPRQVLVVDELPRTPTGKVARRALPGLLDAR